MVQREEKVTREILMTGIDYAATAQHIKVPEDVEELSKDPERDPESILATLRDMQQQEESHVAVSVILAHVDGLLNPGAQGFDIGGEGGSGS